MNRNLSLIKRSFSSRIIKEVFLVVIIFILVNVIAGLLGNSAYNGSLPTWLKSTLIQIANHVLPYLSVIVSFVLVLSLSAICVLGYWVRNLQKSLIARGSLAELDDSQLRLLTNLVSEQDSKSEQELQNEMQRHLRELLRDATCTILGKQNKGRAAILFPQTLNLNEEYLSMLAYHRIPSEIVTRSKFYIGKDESKEFERGLEGLTYLDGHSRIGHIIKKGGYWDCDDDNFNKFDDIRDQPLYRSFACEPIVGLSKGGKIIYLGVLYIDSRDLNAFDNNRARILLLTVSRRCACSLSIYLQLVQSRH